MAAATDATDAGAHDDVDALADDIAAARDAQAGSRAAFRRLYEGYAPMVHAILLARAPATDVDDLVQEVFVAAWRRMGELRDAAVFGAWIASIARHRAVDAHRRQRPTEPLTDQHFRAPTLATAEALAILEVIRRLPDAYREPLVMRFVQGMTGPEIAMRTGMTAGSVRVNLHRGVQLLRRRLAGEEGRPGHG